MKKGFPQTFLGIAIGWSKRGRVSASYLGNDTERYSSHKFCRTRLHIGIEDGLPFEYCPKCLIRLTPSIDEEKA